MSAPPYADGHRSAGGVGAVALDALEPGRGSGGTSGRAPGVAGLRARLGDDAARVLARYPRPRSALLPLLHLVQAEDGHVTQDGIEFCAQALELTTAEVSAVATFYTQYKRHPVGTYAVGVCTNSLCAIMGGDEVYETLKDHLGVGNDETTADGAVTLEHLECNAACDYAPVVMVNWEFFDNATPESAVELVDRLRAGDPPLPTRGAPLCSFRETSRVLAGFYDGRADEGLSAGPATLAGLRLAQRDQDGAGRDGADAAGAAVEQARRPGVRSGDEPSAEEIAATGSTGYGRPADGPAGPDGARRAGPSGSDAGLATAASDPANPAQQSRQS